MAFRTAEDFRRIFKTLWTSGSIAAGDAGPVTISGKAGYTIMVQRVIIDVTTDAAQTITIRDSNGTPKVLHVIAASPGLGRVGPPDWGAEGIALTEGKDLLLALSAAGLAFNYVIEAYLKPTGVLIPSGI